MVLDNLAVMPSAKMSGLPGSALSSWASRKQGTRFLVDASLSSSELQLSGHALSVSIFDTQDCVRQTAQGTTNVGDVLYRALVRIV